MVTILKDDSATYDTLIKTHLRAYNNQFVQNTQFDTHYLYITQDQALLGMIQVSYMWDWLTIKALTYDSLDVLTLLIQEVWQTFNQDCEGIKSFTPSLKRHQDFLEAGFEQSTTVLYGNVPIYYADYFGKTRVVHPSNYACIHEKNLTVLFMKKRKPVFKPLINHLKQTLMTIVNNMSHLKIKTLSAASSRLLFK